MNANLTVKTTKLAVANIFNAIAAVAEDATFTANPEGLQIRTMDPSHVTVLDIAYANSDFEIFECPSEIKFGVRASEISKAIKKLGKKDDDQITITLTDNTMIKLQSGERFYEFRLLEASSGSTPLPKLRFTGSITMPHAYFKEILAAVEVINNAITIAADGDTVKLGGIGETNGEFWETIRHQPDSLPPTVVELKEQSKATFSLDYIKGVINAVNIDSIKINVADKMPVLFQMGRISYFVAPKVND